MRDRMRLASSSISRDRRFNDHGLYAASTERVGQVAVDALLTTQGILAGQALALFAFQEGAVVQPALGIQALVARLVPSAMRIDCLTSKLRKPLTLRGQ
jgi:hypothetical protein